MTEEESDDEERISQEWYDEKTSIMVDRLGDEHDIVMHSLIPYAVGGSLDLYYFPHGVKGTAIATKELCEFPGEGSSNDLFKTYELVMFTKHAIGLDDANDESTPFGSAHHSINAILNHIAPYSEEATLNPNDTCEFPKEMEVVGGKCLIFDAYGNPAQEVDFGLLLIIEIHRSELNYARRRGGLGLIEKLKQAGHYPFSDLDRPPVA